jgi:hypothetical protein
MAIARPSKIYPDRDFWFENHLAALLQTNDESEEFA